MHARREAGYLRLLAQLAREDLEGAVPAALAAIGELTGARAVGLDVTDVRSSEIVLRAHAGSSGEAVSLELVVVPVSAGGLRGVITASFAATHPPGAADVARIESLGALLVRRVDRLRERSREREARDRLVSLIAHDLRGPLQVAKSCGALIARTAPSADAMGLLARADRALDRADRMIGDLLEANRVRAGAAPPLHVGRCDLVQIVGAVVDELAALHGDRFRIEGEASVRGEWNAEQLRRAVWNLATNAIRHGARTSPIRIRVGRNGGCAEIAVRNEGPAIRPEDCAKLFDPYARAQATTAGWGLGLTMVRGSAEAHGGTVDVTSAEGAGTTFTIRLPRGRARRGRAA